MNSLRSWLEETQKLDERIVKKHPNERDYFQDDGLLLSARRWLKLVVASTIVDPLQVYKSNKGATRSMPNGNRVNAARCASSTGRYRHHRNPALRLEIDKNYERKVARWQKFTLLVLAYLVVKFTALALLRYAIYLIHLDREAGLPVNESTVRRLEEASAQIGDPLSEVPLFAVLGYLSICWPCLIASGLWPIYCNRRTVDLLPLRFLLEPLRELLRLDLVLEEKVESIMSSIGRFEQILLAEFGLRKLSVNSQARGLIGAYLEKIARQRRLTIGLSRECHLLRPSVYSPRWYRLSCLMAMLVVGSMVGAALAIMPTEFLFVTLLVVRARCEARKLSALTCGFGQVFNWREFMVLVELPIGAALLLWNITWASGMIALQVMNQFRMLAEIGQELGTCLEQLRYANIHRSQMEPKGRDLLMDSLLLRTLIRYLVFEEDSKSCLRFLSSALSLVTVTNTFAVSQSLFAKHMGGIRNIELYLFAVIWSLENGLFVISASVSARAMKVRKLGWSILAEDMARRDSADNIAPKDPLMILWRKLVHNSTTMENQYAVEILGIKIDYGKILEANFSIVTIISLFVIQR